MKAFIISFIVLLLLSSCTYTPLFYHSTAEIPYYHKSIKSELKLIKGSEEKFSSRTYGVLSATDNDTLHYIIIAPSKEGIYANEISKLDLISAVVIVKEKANEFLGVLNYSIDHWFVKIPPLEAINYEFMIAPEQKIVQKSDSVKEWHPTIKFFFQNNQDGPLANLIIISDGYTRSYVLNDYEKIIDLQNLIKLALQSDDY